MLGSLFDLSGKCAFITGATKGIGRATAEAFVDHGARVALTSRNRAEAETAAAKINARAGRDAVIGFEADILDLPSNIAAYDVALARFGQIDILVCNAASMPLKFGPAVDFTPEETAEMMRGNIINNIALMNHAAVAMKQRRDGVILVTSSGAGLRPTYGTLPYSVSKAGLNHAVRCLAGELAPFNVRVNAVAPGLTRTFSVEKAIEHNPRAIETFKQSIPLRRLVEPEEIAAGMVFLATAAGRSMTGQTISIDGGEPGAEPPSGN